MSDDTKFDDWLKKVDDYMRATYGADHMLFEFYDYRVDFNNGKSPEASAESAVMNDAQDAVFDETGEVI